VLCTVLYTVLYTVLDCGVMDGDLLVCVQRSTRLASGIKPACTQEKGKATRMKWLDCDDCMDCSDRTDDGHRTHCSVPCY
jgi:hypothetical protein